MKILSLKKPLRVAYKFPEIWILLGLLFLLWLKGRDLVQLNDPNAGIAEQDTWLYVLQALMVFLVVISLIWWVLKRFWMELGLPALNSLVVHFKTLELWQQLGFYFASFALLLLAAVGCLIAVC